MKISCILTSYNRPNLVRQALRSVERQTYKNYELIVRDESDLFGIGAVLSEFKFPSVSWRHAEVSAHARAWTNRLSLSINQALEIATGELICYLADDDYFYPDWFMEAVAFFKQHPEALQGFGSLVYSGSMNMDWSQVGTVRFFDQPLSDPLGKLDHGMVMHRRRIPPALWPTGLEAAMTPDGLFFEQLAKEGPFYPIQASAVVKRMHRKNLQKNMKDVEGLRE